MGSFKQDFTETLLGLYEAVHEKWEDFIQFLREAWPILLALLCILIAILLYADPPPPRHVVMATGQPGSSFDLLGKKYAQFFAKKGITLELVESSGAEENIKHLMNRNDPIQAAFVQAGAFAHPHTKGIQTLGAVAYDPIWFFYRGPIVRVSDFTEIGGRMKYFVTKKISVGVKGSATYSQAMNILKLAGLEEGLDFVYMSGEQSVEALIKGEIDGAFIVDAYESTNVQTLLKAPDLHLSAYQRAAAYAKLTPYYHILNVPEGSFNIARNLPDKDISLVATTTQILIDDRMHPAIQFLFLEAASEINGKESFFARRGEFPSFKDSVYPESPVAVHYERNRYPLLADYFPFWIAELVNRLVFVLLPFCVLAYPLLLSLPSFRTRRMHNKINRLYAELKLFEQNLLEGFDSKQQTDYLQRLDRLEYRALNLKVSKSLSSEYYSLRTSIDYVRNCLNRGVRPYELSPNLDSEI